MVKDREPFASDRRRGLSQNYDKDQNQDQEDQRARTEEYRFAHYIGLQQILAPQKPPPERLKGEWHGSPHCRACKKDSTFDASGSG